MATEEAIALKESGNKAFKAHNWLEAIDFYTKAIEAYDQEPSFYTNRSQVGRKKDTMKRGTRQSSS